MGDPSYWHDRKNAFLNHLLLAKRFSLHTYKSYALDINQFISFSIHLSIQAVSLQHCRSFIQSTQFQSYSARTVARKIGALRAFWKYMIKMGDTESNPWILLKIPTSDRQLPHVVETDSLNQFLNTMGSDTPVKSRDRIILELLYATGLRVSELIGIDIADICLDTQTIRVIGKGNKERIVLFGQSAKTALIHYMASARPLWAAENETALFVNRHRDRRVNGRRLSARSIQRILSKLSLQSGIRMTPHTLRHNFATDMLNAGADLKTIQELLGHSSVVTTQIYARLSDQNAIDELITHHPFFTKKINY